MRHVTGGAMSRLHFYAMSLIALLYGLLTTAEYVMVSYGLRIGWLDLYPPEQIAWLETLPAWVHGVFAFHALIALVGALCLMAHVAAAVWMLAFAFLSLCVLYGWMIFLSRPTIIELTGGGSMPWVLLALVLALSFLVYLYARQEKVAGDVL